MKNIILPLLAKFRRRDTLNPFENTAKIMRRTKPTLISDVLQLLIGKAEHMLCLCDAKVEDIIIDAHAKLFLEYTGQIKLANKELICQRIQRDLST